MYNIGCDTEDKEEVVYVRTIKKISSAKNTRSDK